MWNKILIKNPRHFLLGIILCMNFFTVKAYDFSADCNGQILFFNIISDTVPYSVEVVPKYQNDINYDTFPKGNIVIPSTIMYNENSYKVIGVGYLAFYYCVDLLSINLPDSIEYIADYAFCGCKNLDYIQIPKRVAYIGIYVFGDCEKLQSVQIDSMNLFYKSYNGIVYDYSMDSVILCPSGFSGHVSIYDQTKVIKKYAFGFCQKITSVDFGYNIEIIEDYAFEECYVLSGTLLLPNTLKYIGYGAFSRCLNITDTLIIPDSVIIINDYAFFNCKNIKKIVIGNSVQIIPNYAFTGCMGLRTVIFGSSVKEIQELAFYSCIKLKSVTFSHSLEIIGMAAFSECLNLQGKLVFGEHVKVIESYAFSNCTTLVSVVMADSINYIGEMAFNNCSNLYYVSIGSCIKIINPQAFTLCANLKNVTIGAVSPPFVYDVVFDYNKPGLELYIPCGSKNYYQNDTNWNKFPIIKEGDMTHTIDIDVDNFYYGIATATSPNCVTLESVLNAIPNAGYVFEKWSDGDTNNPRKAIITSDTSFIAMFKYILTINESKFNNNLTLYPNPSSYQFTLDNGQELMKEVYLYDVMGRKVKHLPVHAPSTTIDVNDLPNGIYVVKINTASGVLVRKVQVVR